MKAILTSVLLVILCFSSNVFACSCSYYVEDFCQATSDNEHIMLARVHEIAGSHEMKIEVMESLYLDNPIGETITILGQDGINCATSFNELTEGKTYVMALDFQQDGFYFQFNLDTDPYDWQMQGCGLGYLEVDQGQVIGNINGVEESIPYDAFVSDLAACIDASFMPLGRVFAPIGSKWRLRGMNMEDSHQQNMSTCLVSGCGGSYWEYAVNRREIVNQRLCSILEVHHGTEINNLLLINEIPIYEEADQVYFYEDIFDEFRLLYDFGLEVGDTLFNYSPYVSEDYSIMYAPFDFADEQHANVLLDIDTMMIGGELRIHQKFGFVDEEQVQYGNFYNVIEGIGNIGPFFGDSQLHTDEIECEGQFLCYEDDGFSYSVYGDDCDCQFQQEITSVTDVTLDDNIDVFPNPTSDLLNIVSDLVPLQSLSLHDMTGKVVVDRSSMAGNRYSIQTSTMHAGLYILNVTLEDGSQYFTKVWVE